MTTEHSDPNGDAVTNEHTTDEHSHQQQRQTNKGNDSEIMAGNGNSNSTRKRRTTSDGSKGQEGSETMEEQDMRKAEVLESTLKQAISHTWVVPDGGYGWVVMVCSLFISVIVDGVTYTFGVFLNDLEDAFQEPKSTVTLANSLQVGLYLISGPVVSALTNRYGCRPVVIVGSVIVGIAFIVSAFSPSISVLIFTYGVMGGIGFGMMYLPSVVAVSIYFDSKRALATGIAVCGSGIGTFVMAPLSEILLMEYGWRWTMILLGGVVLNGIVCGALIRPLELRFDEKSAKVVDIQMEEDSIGVNNIDNKSISSSVSNRKISSHKSEREKPEVVPLITLTDDNEKTQVIITPQSGKRKKSTSVSLLGDTLTAQAPDVASDKANGSGGGGNDYKFFSSTPNFSSAIPNKNQQEFIPKRQKSDSCDGNYDLLMVNAPARKRSSTMTSQRAAPIGLAFIGVSDMYLNKLRDDLALPLSRKDINRSMAQIESGESPAAIAASMRSLESYASNGHIAFDDDVTVRKSKGLWGCLPESARDTFDEMMNLSIFEEKRYWFVIAGNFLCMFGFYVPFVYIPGRAMELGVSDEKAATLISVIGITNLIGRVATGVLVNYLPIEPVLVTTIALALGGLVTIVCPFCHSYEALVVIAAVFGLCVAAYISLCSILLCELLGVRNLTNAFGYVILFRGIACIMGPPIAGALIDSTGEFDPAFYVGGGMIALGALFHLFLLTPCVKRLKPS